MTVLSTALLSSLLLSGSMMASADLSPVVNMTETLMSGTPTCLGGGSDNCAQCADQVANPWCGGTNFPWNEMSCSPFKYYPQSSNSRVWGQDDTCTTNDDPLWSVLTNDEQGYPNYGVRAWAANFDCDPSQGQFNDEYFVFHGCDSAGIQGGDCLGDIKYFERFGTLYDDTSKGVSNGCVWSDSLQKYFADDNFQTCYTWDETNNVPLGLDEARNNGWWNDGNTEDGFQCEQWGDDVRYYCKFIHPGTQKVYNDYRGGWGGDTNSFIDFWANANMPTAINNFHSAASPDWWNFDYDYLPNLYTNKHPYAWTGNWFSFALFQWRASDSGSWNNYLSYPSIRMEGKKMYVDNEPGGELDWGKAVGHPPEVEVYLAGLDTSQGNPQIWLTKWKSNSDGTFPQNAEYEDAIIYPIRWEDVRDGRSCGAPW